MFFGIVLIVPMFVAKDSARRCFLAHICANSGAHAHFGVDHTHARARLLLAPQISPGGWDLARSRVFSQILARICAKKQSWTKFLATTINIGTIPKNMPTNFQLKRLKPKLDIYISSKNLKIECTN